MPSVKMPTSIQYQFDKVEREVTEKEAKWQAEWDNIVCPFEKVRMYCDEKRRAERKALYDKLHKAKDKLEAARAKKRKEMV